MVAWIDRIEGKLNDWPLIIGMISGVLVFIPFFQAKERSKSGKFIPVGQLFTSSNSTMVDDYEAYSIHQNSLIFEYPTFAELYYGALWMSLPTAVDTIIEILKIVAESWYHRDLSVLSKVHVDRSFSDDGIDIVRLTHLERLVFTVGVICLSFPIFTSVQHYDYANMVCFMFGNLSTILTLAPIYNFLQRSSTCFRPVVSVALTLATCLPSILSSITTAELHFVGTSSTLLVSTATGNVVVSALGGLLIVVTCSISCVQCIRKRLRSHAWKRFSDAPTSPITGISAVTTVTNTTATTAKSREADFRDLVVGVHMLACFVGMVINMFIAVYFILIGGGAISGTIGENLYPSLQMVVLASYAVVYLVEMRIRQNEVVRAMANVMLAQQAGAKELATNLQAPLHSSWLALHLLMNDFSFRSSHEHASKYAVVHEAMGGCLTAMSLVNDPCFGSFAQNGTNATDGAQPQAHGEREENGSVEDTGSGSGSVSGISGDGSQRRSRVRPDNAAYDPMVWMACTRRVRLDALLADCLRPITHEASMRGLQVRLNGVGLVVGTVGPVGQSSSFDFSSLHKRVAQSLRSAVSQTEKQEEMEGEKESGQEPIIVLEVDKVMLEYAIGCLLSRALDRVSASGAAASEGGGVVITVRRVEAGPGKGSVSKEMPEVAVAVDTTAANSQRNSNAFLQANQDAYRTGSKGGSASESGADSGMALLNRYLPEMQGVASLPQPGNTRGTGRDRSKAQVEIVVADTGDMSGSSGDVPGPAGAHELRLLQRIAACNGGAMWVAVDGAVSSGVLRIPVKKQAGRSVLSQIGWPSFRATGEGDGEGDDRMADLAPPAQQSVKAIEAPLSSASASSFKGHTDTDAHTNASLGGKESSMLPPVLPPMLPSVIRPAVLKPEARTAGGHALLRGFAVEMPLSVSGGSVLSGCSDSEV